ncbi:MAG: 5-formyltetrahydrofolate cyclo-ligase [Arenicella sp.]|jgi:5-formyltetrahydrofolate cyclo-ligase
MHLLEPNASSQKSNLRRKFRSSRQALSASQQKNAATELARNARNYRQLWACAKILSYSAISGEIDPQILCNHLNAAIYHPRITNYRMGRMQFLATDGNKKRNRLGILEPRINGRQLIAQEFDAVLVPLLAFDRQGSRLGMGGGFYDRAFAFKNQSGYRKRPLLIGIAHHFQEAESLTTQSWDVSLDAIITDRELIVL